ncbi:hypothetical protein LEP1GSC171_2636 [Leptospira santarosai str. HAI1380]|nr:hypothetical protein LEP1GSC171_2636 [Leptospira santarosai str. HAI1380]
MDFIEVSKRYEKLSQKYPNTSRIDKTIEIKIMLFIANNESSKVLRSCEQTLSFPLLLSLQIE